MALASDVLKISLFFLAGLVLNLLLPSFLCSQPIKEIVVGKSGITSVLKNYPDSIIEDVQSNTMLFPVDDSVRSFWYKIHLNVDCEISFDIYPSGLGNSYNYILYSKPNDITPQDVFSKNVAPIRKNLYMDAMYITGIGLSKQSFSSSDNFIPSDSLKYIYHTTYHHAVPVKKGDVLLLNVFHVKGSDCGHYFTLTANNSSRKFQPIYESCYAERAKNSQLRYYSYQSVPDPETPEDIPETIDSLSPATIESKNILIDTINYVVSDTIIVPIYPVKPMDNDKMLIVKNEISIPAGREEKQDIEKMKEIDLSVIYEPNALFIIKDSLNKSVIESTVNIVKPKNSGTKIMVGQKGEYELVLAKNTYYHFTFSSVGYKSRDIYFNSDESLEAFESEIFLTPCKEGENFVMNNIYFFPNTYQMKQEGRAELEKLAHFLNNNPKICIEIQGHTSGNKRIKAGYHGSFKGSSRKLSQYRAEFIKKYLTDKGISQDRLRAVGYGGRHMIYAKPQNQSQANKNIRVAILLLTSQQGPSLTTNR